jgi:hypothetical protein
LTGGHHHRHQSCQVPAVPQLARGRLVAGIMRSPALSLLLPPSASRVGTAAVAGLCRCALAPRLRLRRSRSSTTGVTDPEIAPAGEASGGKAASINASAPRLPFRFETGVALFAKRPPRPFPPPFLSPPSGSFSDPLSTFDQSRDRRAVVHGELIRGQTNGDDAVYASDHFVCANDGVGAWSMRPRGHAGCAEP